MDRDELHRRFEILRDQFRAGKVKVLKTCQTP